MATIKKNNNYEYQMHINIIINSSLLKSIYIYIFLPLTLIEKEFGNAGVWGEHHSLLSTISNKLHYWSQNSSFWSKD